MQLVHNLKHMYVFLEKIVPLFSPLLDIQYEEMENDLLKMVDVICVSSLWLVFS